MTRRPTGTPDALVVTPVRLRRVCAGAAGAVVITFGLLALLVEGGSAGSAGPSNSGGGFVGPPIRDIDRLGFFTFGLLVAAAIGLLARPRLVADTDGLRVRNILRSYTLPWAVVTGVSYLPGASWPTLDLRDDDTLALLAVQSADGDRAAAAVHELRLLLEHSRTGPAAGP